MLILPQLVKVKTSGNSIAYYRNLGYECGRNTELIVDVTQLQKNSGVKVKCNCDVCGKLLLRTYHKYNYQHDDNTDMDYCKDCKKSRIKATCLEKYGVEYVGQSQDAKDKMKQTCLERYGSECSLQNPEIKKKATTSFTERYGVENSFQSKELREKAKQTMLERYGVEYTAQSPELREKMAETLCKNNNTPTSSQQIAVYEMLKEQYSNVELNYPVNSFSLDIALFVCDKKIDVEYDGWYWHQDKQKDRRRDEVLKSKGWCILRIRSGTKIPTIEQLIEQINYIIDNDAKYAQIILDDWKEAV